MKAINLSRRLLLLSTAVLCSVAAPAMAQRSNILFILTDDMDNGMLDYMPKLKRLVTDQGVEFRNNFASVSLCCPSRATILRGQYSHNTGIFTNHWPDGGFDKFFADDLDKSTVATWLQRSGYRTGLIGKYLNGYPNAKSGALYIPPGWDHWWVPNGGNPYSQYRYRVNVNGTLRYFGTAPNAHMHNVMTKEAGSFIRASAADPSKKPFFLMLSTYLPHAPATPPQRYTGLYPDAKAPRTPSFNEADVSDKPRWMHSLPLMGPTRIAALDELYRKRTQSARALDDMVETLVATLQATGQLGNTYIFFGSDNGFHQGQHRMPTGKSRIFEEDIRVALVARGPGITPGRVVTQLTANVDYAPTFAAIAGADAPDFVDGRSLQPFFAGTPARWRQSLLLESPTSSEGKGTEMGIATGTEAGVLEPYDNAEIDKYAVWVNQIYRGLRTASNKTFALYENGDGEYYDMNADPHQLDNRYKTMPWALKNALKNQLASLRGAAGQALRNAEEVPAGGEAK